MRTRCKNNNAGSNPSQTCRVIDSYWKCQAPVKLWTGCCSYLSGLVNELGGDVGAHSPAALARLDVIRRRISWHRTCRPDLHTHAHTYLYCIPVLGANVINDVIVSAIANSSNVDIKRTLTGKSAVAWQCSNVRNKYVGETTRNDMLETTVKTA